MTLHPKNYRYSHYFFCSRQHQETGVTYGSGYVSKPAKEFSLLSCANLQHKIQDTTYQASEDDNTPDKIALLVAPSRNKSSVRACSKAPVASILNLLRRSVYLLAYVGSARSAGHSLAQVLFGIWQPPEWVGFIPPGEIPELKRHGARPAKCLSTPKRSPSALTLESFSAYQLPSPGPGFTGERRLHRNAAERLGKRQMTWAS